jgi:hypothetical protein
MCYKKIWVYDKQDLINMTFGDCQTKEMTFSYQKKKKEKKEMTFGIWHVCHVKLGFSHAFTFYHLCNFMHIYNAHRMTFLIIYLYI